MKTHFTVTGQGAPVVYLHGWGCDGSVFAPVAELLPDYGNYMLDFAGFGKSSPPPASGYTVFDYVNQLADFFAEQKLSKAMLVAHSFGCRVALVFAATFPNLVDRMLLFAPAGIRRPSFKRWCKVRLYKIRKRMGAVNNARGSDDYQATPNHLKSTFVKVVNQDLSLYARRIACKTLIVAARCDSAVPYASAKRVARLVKNSSFAPVDGDHFALFYAPYAFSKIIRLFAEE